MFVKPKKKSTNKISQPTQEPPVVTAEDAEPDFVPPEVMPEESPLEENTKAAVATPPKKANWWQRSSRKDKMLVLIPAGIVLLAAIGASLFMILHKKPVPFVKPVPVVVKKVVEPPKPTTVAGKLTGVQISPELNSRGVTGVMIENSLDARPQAGLIDAGIVYEAIAEGGITRFLALFQEGQPDYIGPVRSARPYYIRWLQPYNASYMHIGGSGEALAMINALHLRDMGEHGADNPITRITSRYAPHNAYTSMAKLDTVRADRGWGQPDFTGLLRRTAAPLKIPTAISMDFAISSSAFYVHYDYDAASNSYLRSEGGAPHKDDRSGKQLSPKVVVAMIIPYSINADDIHSDYASIGAGQAYVFQDGGVQDVKWSKPTAEAPLTIVDAAGAPLPLIPGQTWFTALGQASMVTYKAPPVVAPAAP